MPTRLLHPVVDHHVTFGGSVDESGDGEAMGTADYRDAGPKPDMTGAAAAKAPAATTAHLAHLPTAGRTPPHDRHATAASVTVVRVERGRHGQRGRRCGQR